MHQSIIITQLLSTKHFLAWRVVMAFKSIQNAVWHSVFEQWSHVAFPVTEPRQSCAMLPWLLGHAPSSLSPPFLLLTQLLVRYCSFLSHTSAQGHIPPGIKGQLKIRTSRKTLHNVSHPVLRGLMFQLHPPACKLLQTGDYAYAVLPIITNTCII